MQVATVDVIGTGGHRRLCRHEGWAYMCLQGPQLIFVTPSLADSKQPLLSNAQGQEIRLDDSLENDGVLPHYRDMLRRLARGPVGQTVMFELVVRMFFLYFLGVRPEGLQNRRGSNRP